ncbi:MAG: HEAT repeat domain-containing protein [Thermodesulfobacteriota bacterium]
MDPFIEKLTNMFSKIMAGTVTREEGGILINHLVKENMVETKKALSYLIENPPRNVFQKTVLHTIALARNKAFLEIMAESLHSDNEDVSLMAASELARLRTEDAKNILLENLNHEIYHVRKSSAIALAEDFGEEGLEKLKDHILTHEEPFYRATSAQALLCAGKRGKEVLFSILSSDNPGAIHSATEVIAESAMELTAEYLPLAVDGLLRSADRRDIPSIVELLKVIALFEEGARKFEDYVAVFTDDPSESVRVEAQRTMKRIRGEN